MSKNIDPVIKEKILSFLKNRNLGVVSTNSSTGLSPESAIVAFSETENLELVFGTLSTTRKHANISKNPNISFVIGWDWEKENKNVQFEGKAILLQGTERQEFARRHIAKNPGSAKFIDDPMQQYYKVVPVWIRYSDFTTVPNDIVEVAFN